MNSIIIFQILQEYKQIPFYKLNDYISINDDRIGRIVSFKIYEENGEIIADFIETTRLFPLEKSRHQRYQIENLKQFKKIWNNYYYYIF